MATATDADPKEVEVLTAPEEGDPPAGDHGHGHDDENVGSFCRTIAVVEKYSVPLFTGVIVGMTLANAAPDFYHDVFFSSWGFSLAGHDVTFAFFINDVLMSIHFGLALQEIACACLPGGAMSPFHKALNPMIATSGGLLGPIGVFFVIASILHGEGSYGAMGAQDHPLGGQGGVCGADPALIAAAAAHRRLEVSNVSHAFVPGELDYTWDVVSKGWGIVTATDIPLAWVGAEIIFGAGHPAITYLLLLAVADDFCGVIIIAAFYPDPNHPFAAGYILLVLGGMLVAYIMRRLNIQIWQLYAILPGGLCWIGLLKAGIHPALSLCPIVPFLPATLNASPFKPIFLPWDQHKVPKTEETESSKADNGTVEDAEDPENADNALPTKIFRSKSFLQPDDEQETKFTLDKMTANVKNYLGQRSTTPDKFKSEQDDPEIDATEKAAAIEMWKSKGVENSFTAVERALNKRAFTVSDVAKAFHQAQQDHVVQVLHHSDIFCEMDREHLIQLAEAITSVPAHGGIDADHDQFGTHFAPGKNILEEGDDDEDQSFYVIARGSVSVQVLGEEVAVLSAGESSGAIFGEIGLLHSAPRNASVVATGDVLCWETKLSNIKDTFPKVYDEITAMKDAYDATMKEDEQFESDFHLSAMHTFEHGLKRFMVFVVLFLFTCANAGVKIETTPGPLALTIWMSLLFGKWLGIVFMALMADRFIAPCPANVGKKEVFVVGAIASIGMTIALFISVEAFASCPSLEADAKIGSLLSVIGFPIAVIMGLAMKVHVDAVPGQKKAMNVNDAIEDMLLINEHHEEAERAAIENAAHAAHEAEVAELHTQVATLVAQVDLLKETLQGAGVAIPTQLDNVQADMAPPMSPHRPRGATQSISEHAHLI